MSATRTLAKTATLPLSVSVLAALYLVSRQNYLLFHSLVELFAIIVACGIFMIAWNARRFLTNNYLLFVGISSLFIALIDILHMLAYKNMGVFPRHDANLPTQLWIAGRYLQGFSLLLAPLWVRRTFKPAWVVAGFAATVALLLASIFLWPVFPDCFTEGAGLTPFKNGSEYLIVLLFTGAFFFLRRERKAFEPGVHRLLTVSVLLLACAEMSFTFYVDVFGIANMAGHLFKLGGYYLIYRALVQTGLSRPYDLLFRELKESEERYRLLIEHAPDAIIIHDGRVFTFANAAAVRLFAADSPEGLLGSEIISRIHPDSHGLVSERLVTLRETSGTTPQMELKLLRLDGSVVEVESMGISIILEGRKVFLTIIRDITERKQAEAERLAAGQRIEELAASLQEANEELVATNEELTMANEELQAQTEEVAQLWDETRKAEESLQKSRLDLLAILDNLPFMAWLKDTDGRFIAVNKPFAQACGFASPIDVIGKSDLDIWPRHLAEAYRADDLEVMQAGKKKAVEEFIADQGVEKWFETFKTPRFDETGRVIGTTGIARDISDRKQAEQVLHKAHNELELMVANRTEDVARLINTLQEEIISRERTAAALRKSEERYTLAVLGANDGIWDWDLETGSAYASPRWKSMLGYSEDEILNVVDEWKTIIHPDDYERAVSCLDRYLAGELPEYRLEYRLRHKDGSYRWILTRGACFRNAEGKPYRMAGSHTDITERKTAEETMREKEQLLMQQSRQAAMGEMIGNIAHQWRQPLNTLGLMIQDLPAAYDHGELDREQLDAYTQKALQLVFHMSRTIEDFRNFFRPDKAKVRFDATKVVTKTLALIDGNLCGQGIRVEVDSVATIFIEGYPNEFSQVLLNILLNARDALVETRPPNPLIQIRLFADGGKNVLTITDNAGGIKDDIMGKIFDPYFTTKEPDKGTGVGLFMAKTIIEKNMQGTLRALNTGSGAEFRIEV